MKRRPTGDPALFDDFAERYDKNDLVTGGWVTDWLQGVLAGRGGGSAIDLGCGSGRVAELLARHYEHVTAIDLSEEMVALARRRHPSPAIEFRRADLMEIEGEYDAVVSVMTIHHLPDQTAALEHVASLARPGGLVVIIDNAESQRVTRTSVRLWALRELVSDVYNAVLKFRFTIDPRWVDHVVSDRYLEPEMFEKVYASALPGAAIDQVAHRYTAVWERPHP